MAKKSRSPSDAAKNYVIRTAAAQTFWQERAGSADWQSNAGSAVAEANYAQGVQAAVAKKSRAAAIAQTPNSVYQSGINANAGRYSTGTAAAENKVMSVMGKLLPDIDAAKSALPPRQARGSTSNIMQRGTGIQVKLAANRGKYKARGIAKSVAGG